MECYSFVCEGSGSVFCSVLLVLCFAGDMMVSSTDLQSVRKTRCVFSPVRVLQMFTASSRAICSACRPRLGVVYIYSTATIFYGLFSRDVRIYMCPLGCIVFLVKHILC